MTRRSHQCLMVVALLVVAALTLTATGAGPATIASERARHHDGLRSYRDVTGWGVRYPAGWQLEISEQQLRLSLAEVTVAAFGSRPGIVVRTWPGGGNVRAVPPLSHTDRFPPDAVAMRVVEDPAAPSWSQKTTRLRRPLGLASLRPSRGPRGLLYNATTGETLRPGRYHGAPRSLSRTILVSGSGYTIVVWIGPRATFERRQALARMIASLTFPARPWFGSATSTFAGADSTPVARQADVREGWEQAVNECDVCLTSSVRSPLAEEAG